MKLIIGLILILGGIIVGVYVGLWIFFIGGIVQIIEQIKSPENVDVLAIAWGIAKIFLAGTVGVLSSLLGIIPGFLLLNK